MRILLTNDDGINAAGIHALKAALDPLGEVFIVAPERPQSASGHAITLHKPLRIDEVELPDGSRAWATNGTPTDCVSLGFDEILEGRVDLVVSGINAGPNLGWDVTYSGTVAGAMEGAILGAAGIAVSVAGDRGPYEYQPAAEFTRQLAERVRDHGLDRWTLLNVNVPAVPREEIRGISITHQGRRAYVDRVDRRVDPWGKPYYWLCGTLADEKAEPGSDVEAVLQRRISVTPIHLDMTASYMLDKLRAWPLDIPCHEAAGDTIAR